MKMALQQKSSLPRLLEHEGVVVAQHIREGRFQRSLSLIAAVSGLLGGLEVTYEHYRGSYGQRVMYSPLILTPLLTIAGVGAVFNRRIARTLLPAASVVLLADGVVGFVFHIRGIARKPGGWRIPIFNLVMGPPVFAPLLLGIGGALGLIASQLRREDDPPHVMLRGLPRQRPAWLGWLPRGISREGVTLERDLREGRFQKALAATTAVSAVLNGAEVWYSHYKNRFQYKVQWTPVLLTPVLIGSSVGAVFSKRVAHTALPVASALALINGAVGFGYHLRGIARRPGNPRQLAYNVTYGPPVFAPLLFAATGFMGLLASFLRRGGK